MTDNIAEEFTQKMVEEVAKATDIGFVKGVKWVSEFMILELEYQNLHEMAQKLGRFVASKEQEWKQEKSKKPTK